MANSRLTRSRNKIIAGVCAGLAEHFGFDTSLVRIVFALVGLFTAILPMCLAYAIMWFIIPQE